jgi:P-type E1-E2 ATPase
MLSGDTEAAATAIARQAGISEVFAQCLPDAKIAAVRAAKQSGEFTAMVGDGINDAPALAEADVAIALAGGTDLAREAGDVTLIGDELSRIPWVLGLARLAYKVIRQNLFWAFGYNAVAMAIAFLGHLHPLIAALAMLGSSLFVLSNSVRVARYP